MCYCYGICMTSNNNIKKYIHIEWVTRFRQFLAFIFVSWFKGVPFHQIKNNDAHVPHDIKLFSPWLYYCTSKIKGDVQPEKGRKWQLKCCYTGKQGIVTTHFITKSSECILAEITAFLKGAVAFIFIPQFNRNTSK